MLTDRKERSVNNFIYIQSSDIRFYIERKVKHFFPVGQQLSRPMGNGILNILPGCCFL